jgi:hypothetical protein
MKSDLLFVILFGMVFGLFIATYAVESEDRERINSMDQEIANLNGRIQALERR